MKIGDIVIVTKEDVEPEYIGRIGRVVKLGATKDDPYLSYKYKVHFSSGDQTWIEDAVLATDLMKALL